MKRGLSKIVRQPPFLQAVGAEEPSVKFDIFVGISDSGEKFGKLLLRDDHRGAIVIRVERKGGPAAQVGIEEEVNMVRRIVDQPEGRDRAGA